MTRLLPRGPLAIALLGMLAVFVYRLSLAGVQIDWDEEVYFQIARHWSAGTIPYRDLFDHKPPMVYLLYKVLSLNGESMAAVRIGAAAILAVSLLHLWQSLRDRLSPYFIPVTYGVLSLPAIAGVNTEILYIPFILLAVSFALRGKVLLPALCAAVAVNVKYTVVLDLTGALIFVLALRRDLRQALAVVAAAAAAALAVFAGFVVYFEAQGVDLLRATVWNNLTYSANTRRDFFLPLVFLGLTAPMFGLAVVGAVTRPRAEVEWRLFLPLAGWWGLSVAQASITGKYYLHYFAPAFLPVSILAFLFFRPELTRIGRAALPATLLACVPLWIYAERMRAPYAQRAAAMAARCDIGPFYMADNFLAAYRICGGFTPRKYLLPGHVLDESRAGALGSAGRDWVCALSIPVLTAVEGGGFEVSADGAAYCRRHPAEETR
jgi:hypothetical protein